ncbi:hypothetical protein [Tichowtungia aerotolerans]|uniref:Right handed beta helix domain-containing protein n=1 Tax=Tichowtungia aerotolerans TaxID=2697043 RepID=A0A6P1MGW5_9BACT|nr:hypothetical protein [Tichowtungia aerotolerans]QHI70325.1 hypothetical protein GT409_13030 [Tichowtungia aerotolerans]
MYIQSPSGITKAVVALCAAGLLAAVCNADVISNFLVDAGFELPDGDWPAYEPNSSTSPWFTAGENADGSFKATGAEAYSGSQSFLFDWYGDAGAVVQNTEESVDVSMVYELSFWMLKAEPSSNSSHTNVPSINIGFYTSTNNGVSYAYASTLIAGAQNSDTNIWEQFSAVISGASLALFNGQKIQLRINKPNESVTHKIYVDDVVFGEYQPEPSTELLKDPGFEEIVDNEPNSSTAPWATVGEGQDGSFVTGIDQAKSGTQSATFTFYFDDGAIVQNLTNRIDATMDYAASVWMLTAEPSSNPSHTNSPSLAIQMYSSPAYGSDYTYLGTFTAENQNSDTNVWEVFSGVISGGLLAGREGEYIQIRFAKENMNATHRMWIDDASFTAVEHVPMTYYLDAASGSDTNNGLSTLTPWQTMERLNGETFGAGDQILFKRGRTFTGRFVLNGGGTPESPLVIAAYGSGNKPVLNGGTNDREVIYAEGSSGFEVRNLQIRNYHPTGVYSNRFGVVLDPPVNAGDLQHIWFINVDFSAIQGAGDSNPDDDHESRGIQADINNTDNPSVLSRWNDFRIEQCLFENIDGRGAQVRDSCHDIADYRIRGYSYYPSIGVVFQNNTGSNCYRNLFQINGTKDALIQYNTMDGTQEGSAFWPFACEGTLVQFNVFRNILKDGADASCCHFDFNCVDSLMQYNLGINCQGSLIQVLNNSNGTNFQINAVARYNLGIDCGWRDSNNSAGIMITGDSSGSKIYNNTVITTDLHPAYKAISFANWGGAWPTNSFIANNLFFAAGSASTYANTDWMVQRDNVITHNLYAGNLSVCSADISPVSGYPGFVNSTGSTAEDFRITYGSAAIGAGALIPDNGGVDYFGNLLTNMFPTIGFHEYQTDPSIDSDGDLIPDFWERVNGLLPAVNDAFADADGDQKTNLDEYAANTDPADPTSFFAVQVLSVLGQLDWDQRPDRLYQVFQALELSGIWDLIESNAVPPVSVDFEEPSQFYKIEVSVPGS